MCFGARYGLVFVALLSMTTMALGQAPGADSPKPFNCAAEPSGNSKPVDLTINPANPWQPRGGEFVLQFDDSRQPPAWVTLRACIGWLTDTSTMKSAKATRVTLRSSDSQTTFQVGIAVPTDLEEGPTASSDNRHATGLGVVPVATLRLVGLDQNGKIVLDEQRQVGISSVWISGLASCLAVLLGLALLYATCRSTAGRFFLLQAVTTARGTAGLAESQILLWSFVVGGSIVYVMCLTGNLVNLSAGTLQLLGIAIGAVVLAKLTPPTTTDVTGVPDASAAMEAPTDSTYARWTPTAAEAGTAPGTPKWSDLVKNIDGSGMIDLTRIQMLIFTAITAAFVVLKVLDSCVIPSIPPNYLLLMGISNGAYVAGRYVAVTTMQAAAKG